MIKITSNGSKWYGEQPDSIEKLIEVLNREPLDPTFENYGNFVIPMDNGEVRLSGNFHNLSHVFSIDGKRKELGPVIRAIRRNQRTTAYQQAKLDRGRSNQQRME